MIVPLRFAVVLLLVVATSVGSSNGQYLSTGDQYIPQTPPSWNATSILATSYKAKGLYTGTTDITIPIYAVQSRKLSVPIGLRYEPGGVKVHRMASWVGLNWSLEAGGLIGKVAQGAYDTYSTTNGVGTYNQAIEPDVFHFSFLGRSGTFALFTQSGPTIWRTMPNSNLKIAPIWSSANGAALLNGFSIVDESGTIFEFTAIEQTQIRVNGQGQAVQNTAWYLTRVRTADFGDEVTFTYESFVNQGSQFLARSAKSISLGQRYHTADAIGLPIAAPSNHSSSACGGCPIESSRLADTLFISQEVVLGQRLQRITFVNGRVDFVRSTSQRSDLAGDYRLDSIKVSSTYWGTGANEISIAKWKLDYGQFSASAGAGRLKLNSVRQLYTELGSAKSLSTNLFYDESGALPPRTSCSVDLWGYFNNSSNTSVAPGIANRDTFGSAAQRGSLIKIVTALGAETYYTLESHTASSAIGGRRIKSVEVRPNALSSDTANIFRGYVYTIEGSSSTSGLALPKHCYYDETLWKVTTPSGCTPPGAAPRLACGSRVQGSYTHTDFWRESSVEYSRVEEHLGQNSRFGRSVYVYSTQQSSNSSDVISTSYAGALPTLREWRRGLLTGSLQYDMTNVLSPQLVTNSSSEYVVFDIPLNNFRSQTSSTSTSFTFSGDTYPRNGISSLESGWLAPRQTISRSFTQDATPVGYSDTTRYSYSPLHLHLTEQEAFRAAGKSHGTLFVYADSSRYDSTAASTNPQAKAIWHLRRLNIRGIPVETITFQRNYLSTTREILGTSLQKFQTVTSVRGTTPRAYETLEVRLASPLSMASFTPSSVTGINFVNDSRYPSYNQNGRILYYNSFGLPFGTVDSRGVYSWTVWGYNNTLPVASCSNGGINYSSFEDPNLTISWESFNGAFVSEEQAFSGKRSCKLNAGQSFTTEDNNNKGYVSFWVKAQGSAGAVRINHGGSPLDVSATNEWKHVMLAVMNTFMTVSVPSGSGGVYIDDFRAQSLESTASSAVFEPLIGPIAVFNGQNIPTLSEYDSLNRPYLTRNKDKDILQVQSFKIK